MAYEPTVWQIGDVISAERMNHLEQGVANEQIGPQGPQGPQGDTGPAGPQGPAGQDGITSFNGRTGAIKPQDGDYTAEQVSFSADKMQAQNVQDAIVELFTSGSEGKALVASAITAKGVETPKDAAFQTLHDNILRIAELPEGVYKINLSVDPPDSGKVTGGGYASAGMTCSAKAEAIGKYRFSSWKENGEFASSTEDYNFTVERDRDLVAEFTEQPSRLPEGYTEVEWIQNANTSSYIDTKKSLNSSEFTLEFSLPDGPKAGCYVFYTTGGYWRDLQVSSYVNRLSWLADYVSASSYNYYTVYNNLSTEKVKITGSGKTVNVNGTVTTMNYANYTGNIIFPVNSSRNSQIVRIYYFKCESPSSGAYCNFELIPCINPQGIVGLYDLTNNAFIAPTGTFTAGPAV